VPLLITEADSSQFAAIADVMDGKNLAIKGPPGTGKSQTITNILAAALAKRMKVLFVAEKMAALEVVKKRLDEAGLGEFCLELHSTKARKQDALESLRKRLGCSTCRSLPH
jgi:predicted ATP-dependent serine protease